MYGKNGRMCLYKDVKTYACASKIVCICAVEIFLFGRNVPTLEQYTSLNLCDEAIYKVDRIELVVNITFLAQLLLLRFSLYFSLHHFSVIH